MGALAVSDAATGQIEPFTYCFAGPDDALWYSMFRLDYISCLLTIASTILVGRRMWQGWIIAGANSLIICFIGLRTTQLGFIPANLFCLVIYVHNIMEWRNPLPSSKPTALDAVSHFGNS